MYFKSLDYPVIVIDNDYESPRIGGILIRALVEELRSNIEFLKEEIAKQLEYREVIADELEDEEPTGEPDDEATARTRRHLGHLDREMAEMKAKLAAKGLFDPEKKKKLPKIKNKSVC